MTSIDRPARRQRASTRFTKLAVAVGVFTVTLTAGNAASDFIRDQRPLPSSDATGGRCSLWLVGSSSMHRWQSAGATFAGWHVNNRGVEGALLPDLRRRLSKTKAEATPSAVIFYAGENDIARGASGAAAAREVLALVAELRPHIGGAPVFVVSMKPSPTRWKSRDEQLRFDAIIRAAAPRDRYTFLPVGAQLLSNGRPGDFYQPDGIHLSERGYRLWGGAIRDDVAAALPATVTSGCPPLTTAA